MAGLGLPTIVVGYDSVVELEAAGDVPSYLQLDVHGEVEFPEHLSLSPDLCSSWPGVELVLDSARVEPFDSMVVHPDTLQVLNLVHLQDHGVELLQLVISVPEIRGR